MEGVGLTSKAAELAGFIGRVWLWSLSAVFLGHSLTLDVQEQGVGYELHDKERRKHKSLDHTVHFAQRGEEAELPQA